MTLRTRFTLLTVGLLLALLVIGGAFQYVALGASLQRQESNDLKLHYQQAVRGFAILGLARRCPLPARPQIATGELPPQFAGCLADLMSQRLAQLTLRHVDVVILDPTASTALGETRADYALLSAADYDAVAHGSVRTAVANGGSGQSIVLLEPLRPSARGRVLAIAQVSESTAPMRAAQQSLLLVLAGAAAILIVLALLVTPLLVRRALRPLARVTDTSAAIARGDLARRVEVPPTRDEVGILAETFNEMAASVQSAFAARASSEAGMRRFIADASHELRTPLTTIQGELDLLGRSVSDDPALRQQALTAMQRDVQRMSTLVQDLLTLARLDNPSAGRAERQPVDIGVLVLDTVDEESVRAPEQRIQLDNVEPGRAVVLGDREQLRRAIVNIANNALKYAPGGTHTWRCEVMPAEVTLSLRDGGPGIPADDLGRIFDRFHRASLDSSQSGSGLGLAIVRSIAEAHGGSASAANNNGAAGATFTLRLPRTSPPTAG